MKTTCSHKQWSTRLPGEAVIVVGIVNIHNQIIVKNFLISASA